MKSRKSAYDKDLQPVILPHKDRNSISRNGSSLTKRR